MTFYERDTISHNTARSMRGMTIDVMMGCAVLHPSYACQIEPDPALQRWSH